MKRPRSYGVDFDDDGWPRQDPDPDCPPAHHHRRHSSYSSSKTPSDGSRKGVSAPQLPDDDRDPPTSLVRRKRCFDYEPDGFDRRQPSGGGFDRYRDSGAVERAAAQSVSSLSMSSALSPRGLYGGDRMYHRSECFSVLRRNFPKGFRSERDRSRRNGGGCSSRGLSWRRSISSKENSSSSMPAAATDAATKEVKKSLSPDSESAGRRSRAVSHEDRRRVKAKSTDSGADQRSIRTQSSKVEKPKTDSCNRESGSDNEMEEGELEPDLESERQQPLVEPSADANTSLVGVTAEKGEGRDLQSNLVSKTKMEKKENLTSKKLVSDGCTEVDGKSEAISADMVVKQETSAQMVQDPHHEADNEGKKKTQEEVQATNADDMDAKLCSDKQELVQEDDNNSSLPCRRQEINDNNITSLPCQSEEFNDNEAGKEVIGGQEKMSLAAPLSKEKEPEEGIVEARVAEDKPEAMQGEELGEEPGIRLEVEQKEQKLIDLVSKPDGAAGLYGQSKRVDSDNNCGLTLKLMTDKPKQDCKDKGKGLAISVSSTGDYADAEHGDADETPSGRGFELFSGSPFRGNEKTQPSGVLKSKHKDENLKIEILDLSLSLPGALADHPPKRLKHRADSPSHAMSIQSLPSSFRKSSDGFTTSISISASQPFLHNHSCSLTQNSLDNYDNSVSSHPVFPGMDHLSSGSIWQAHNLNETKPKIAPQLFNKTLLNGSIHQVAPNNLNSQHQSKPNGILKQSSLSRQLSPTCSQGSHDARSHKSKDKRLLSRERSSSNLFRNEIRDVEQLAVNGAGVTEKILSKIVTEPLHLNGRMLQNMTENSIVYLKETICEMLMDAEKSRQICAFQDALQGRSDMTMDMLGKCPKVLLEILVALKTGLPIFIQRMNNIPSSELVEIFLNLRCRNIACRNMLPVDDCDCTVCNQKTGFCSTCMCLVCSKFDNAFNTCSWVGCDICLHWCHTDCGLRDSHIKNGRNASGGQGTSEMQFHCIACNHPSEMFGFVKEVFKTCAKDWKEETLAKELQFVRRIFSLSNDSRGKRLCYLAEQMLVKLENKANASEVIGYIMAFLSDVDFGINRNPSIFLAKEVNQTDGEGRGIACPSKDATWLQSLPSDSVSLMDNAGTFSSIDHSQMRKKAKDAELQLNIEKKPAADELESVVKFKQAEANMYQERADAARREAEGLKGIAKAKNNKIEEDYRSRVAKLRLVKAEERRRQKLQELHAIEKTHREYFNMKIRMEADIKELLIKMEATRQNFAA